MTRKNIPFVSINPGDDQFDLLYALINCRKPVKVYRNLHKSCYSVQQGGRVVCHVNAIELWNVKMTSQRAGREKVLKTGRKNVHAFAVGRVSVLMSRREYNRTVTYNPYKAGYFQSDGSPVSEALYLRMSPSGLTAIGPELASKDADKIAGLAEAALPRDGSEWGSEQQIESENQMYSEFAYMFGESELQSMFDLNLSNKSDIEESIKAFGDRALLASGQPVPTNEVNQ